jgi:prepilin-type N-terminal cleavage/methylation domain-containing protein
MKSIIKSKKMGFGFTLIELLVVIAIIGILLALSVFGLQAAKQSARDARRTSDLEQIRSGLELYKADCGDYPATLPASLSPLLGDGTPTACAAANTYISSVPGDPSSPRIYRYARLTTTTYELCAALELVTSPSVACGGVSTCGGTINCTYKVTNP